MAKWADYCISAVRYDSEHDHIDSVRVHPDNGDSIGSSSEWTRASVVSSIDSGKSFITITSGSDGKWHKGADVHIITVNGVRYLRTDNNSTGSDNLENLPEF